MKKLINALFEQGYGRQLLVTILLMVLVPMTIVGYISYDAAKKQLYENSVSELKFLAKSQKQQLEDYYGQIVIDISLSSNQPSNIQSLHKLIKAQETSDLPLNKFINSYAWAVATENLVAELSRVQQRQHYYDVFLLDIHGNILFTLAKEDDLGTNLFHGKYQKTLFSQAAQQALATKKMVFSDAEFYGPSGEIVAEFFVLPMLDEYGNTVGLYAIQVSQRQVEKSFNDYNINNNGIKSYLVGEDLLMRTNAYSQNDILKATVDNKQTQQWLLAKTNGSEALNSKIMMSIYHNAQNVEVLGILQPFYISQKRFAIITEEPIKLVLATSVQLAYKMLIIILISFIVVIVVTQKMTRRIVRPILLIAKTVQKITQGDLKYEINYRANNELSDLASGINNMVESLRGKAVLTQEIVEANEELQASSEELQAQQEELRIANEELRRQGDNLQESNRALEIKAQELADASRYKSEFLANMSHELRTPLNSLLILSQSLAENDEGNLNEDDVIAANIIQDSGKHLLALINDILDLSKVEAGKMLIENRAINLTMLSKAMSNRFNHMAKEKQITFTINISPEVPEGFMSDEGKLHQILSNLISNAIKFTAKGEVILNISYLSSSEQLPGNGDILMFSVVDSGVGIAQDKQEAIFDSFQQADGSTSRQYGGTGLGLSIARSFSELLSGKITLTSALGTGSNFTLYLPCTPTVNTEISVNKGNSAEPQLVKNISYQVKYTLPALTDDRTQLTASKPLFLIIEDDESFAKIIFDTCHQQEAQAIVAPDGETGLTLVKEYPITGIILDYMLPGMDGKDVLAILKANPHTQHIPVHIISAVDASLDLHSFGIVGQLTKPVAKADILSVLEQLTAAHNAEEVHLLLVEDDNCNILALRRLFQNDDIKITSVQTGQDAISTLQQQYFTAIILDLSLPDMTGFELLKVLENNDQCRLPPVIVHTGKELTDEEYQQLHEITETIVIKSDSSLARLQDEVHLFINAIGSSLDNDTETVLEIEEINLFEKTVLLVDDDMRNTFALAKILRKKGLVVHIAPSGKDALLALDKHTDIDIVLMDIMMPEMDGFEAIGHIRAQAVHTNLPVIALTAKAMPGDKEQCLAAGANDYLTKPADVQKLLVVMQMWLSKVDNSV